jgi:hypothetical protein
MSFYTKTTLQAKCPEFVANLRQSPATGVWGAEINFTSGKREVYSYASESKMRSDLNSRSAYEVKFVKTTKPADDSVETARQAMLASDPRKIDVTQGRAIATAAPNVSALAAAGFSAEEEKAIVDSMYGAAAAIRSNWYANTPENRQTVELFMRDHNMPATAEKYGEAITHLYKNNHLVRLSRKRGDSAIVPYSSPSVRPQRRAEDMSMDELRAIEFARQKEAIRRNKLQNPTLSYAVGRSKI